jgi:hypothetical protein
VAIIQFKLVPGARLGKSKGAIQQQPHAEE